MFLTYIPPPSLDENACVLLSTLSCQSVARYVWRQILGFSFGDLLPPQCTRWARAFCSSLRWVHECVPLSALVRVLVVCLVSIVAGVIAWFHSIVETNLEWCDLHQLHHVGLRVHESNEMSYVERTQGGWRA